MSIACCLPVVECVYCLACARWTWQKCLHSGGYDSETWGFASATEFEPVPRMCRLILSVYEDDLEHPQWAPAGGYGMKSAVGGASERHTRTHTVIAPTYLLYVDHQHSDVVVAVRGMNMAKESDYALLLDNKLGQRRFDGGYVHNGLLKAAEWVFDVECDVLRDLLERNPGYTLTFAGHSLGSGVVAMLALVAVHNRERLGGIDRKMIRCFAMAPARCVSLNLAVRYADIITLLFFRCGRYPPVVRTAVPVDGRFEHVILSCNATSDHAIIWIEREGQRALDVSLINITCL
ncbi:hypothetical protein PR202_ga25281 [Eleusine coracana subsp. coracana]|uniref:Calmodulin-binding heat-shock protein n=1 Tax=Eleusine coracana subsp. coracana TaxID=191504 RepID=A0AAV5DB99_ELECO|nr:hypothetical protein PR202_ga25281 [Eleusine coracana subsp. coracana]